MPTPFFIYLVAFVSTSLCNKGIEVHVVVAVV